MVTTDSQEYNKALRSNLKKLSIDQLWVVHSNSKARSVERSFVIQAIKEHKV